MTDYVNDDHASHTWSYAIPKYGDWIKDELMEWVRGADSDENALRSIDIVMALYDKRKTMWQRIKCLFV
jgi:hypothetical protein